MAIRIRQVGNVTVALCAARSVEKPGDVYLDDGQHQALAEKFREDFQSEGYDTVPLYQAEAAIRSAEESNNTAREWWDRVYGHRSGAARLGPISTQIGWDASGFCGGSVSDY